MAFLKSGEPVVVDSHVLAEAARQERDGGAGVATMTLPTTSTSTRPPLPRVPWW